MLNPCCLVPLQFASPHSAMQAVAFGQSLLLKSLPCVLRPTGIQADTFLDCTLSNVVYCTSIGVLSPNVLHSGLLALPGRLLQHGPDEGGRLTEARL